MRRTVCLVDCVMKILASGKAWAVIVGLGITCPGLAEPPMPQFLPAPPLSAAFPLVIVFTPRPMI